MSLHLAQHTMLKLYLILLHLPSAAHDAPAIARCNCYILSPLYFW